MHAFKFLLLYLLITIGTFGCIKNDVTQTHDDNCDASFIVDEVKGTLSISDETALPEKFTLQLQACIRSQGKIETKLPSTHWAVSNDIQILKEKETPAKIKASTNLNNDNKAIKMTTDGSGCIHWTEEYDYAHTTKSRWIVIDRYIQGISNEYPGACKIPLAVNPWLQLTKHSNIQVADYRAKYHKNNNNLKGRVQENGLTFLRKKKEEEAEHKVNIIIDELDFYADGSVSQNTKRILQGNIIKARLKYSIQDIHNKLHDNQISEGNFKIIPHLLISHRTSIKNEIKTKYIKKNENNELIETRFENHILTSLPFNWVIPYENYNSRIALYLKVIPLGETAKRVNPFEGIYFIGEKFKDIVSTNKKSLKLNPILDKTYRDKILSLQKNQAASPTTTPSPSLIIESDYNNPDECLKALSGQHVISCISMGETDDSTNGFGNAGWTVEKMNLRFFQMERENWLSRKISTIVETSVFDPLQTQKITNHFVTIKVTDLTTGKTETFRKRTELNGNISFNISTTQNWYKRQRYFLKIIHFMTDTKELSIKKMVAINPWGLWIHAWF